MHNVNNESNIKRNITIKEHHIISADINSYPLSLGIRVKIYHKDISMETYMIT